jgi:hypothetical protein
MSTWNNLEIEQKKKLEDMLFKMTGDLLECPKEGIKMSLNNKYKLQEMAESVWDMYIGDSMEEELEDLVLNNNIKGDVSLFEIYDSLRSRFYQIFYEKINTINSN